MRKIGTALIAAALSLALAPAYAQDDDAPRLTVAGEVMVSSGGDYVTAVNGQTVLPGQSLMVHASSAATVTYDDNCVVSYTVPGTYVVPDDCDPAAAVLYAPAGAAAGAGAGAGAGIAGSALGTVAIVGGVVAATAAGVDSMVDDGDEVPPASP